MKSLVYSLLALAISPLILLLPLLTLIAIPLTLLAIFTAPLAIIILYSRVWLVYVDYFLALFYRALIRPNMDEGASYSSYAPGEISRRYNMRNLQQYRYPRGHPPTTPLGSPPALFSPSQIRSRRNSLSSDVGERTKVADSHRGLGTRNGQHGYGAGPKRSSRTGIAADMDCVDAWEDLASIAQHHSHRRQRSSTPLASAYLKPHDSGVGSLPGLAGRHPGTGFAYHHRRHRRSSSVRHEDIFRVQEELEHRHRDRR